MKNFSIVSETRKFFEMDDNVNRLSSKIDRFVDRQEKIEDRVSRKLTKDFNKVFKKDIGIVTCRVIYYEPTDIVVLIHTKRSQYRKDNGIRKYIGKTFSSKVNYRIRIPEFDYLDNRFVGTEYKTFAQVRYKINKFLSGFFAK